MKNNRQKEILDIISSVAVETQGDLIELLGQRGYAVTQATISRDIKELRLVKSSEGGSTYRYVQASAEEQHGSIRYGTILSEVVSSAEAAGNLVVVKTHNGMAMAAATAIDSLAWQEILGTIAGDDTIFVAVRTSESAVELAAKLVEVAV